jgi:D-arabinose 1-dehydrogenase-like Zn-dependent alcohol dehydrogenase
MVRSLGTVVAAGMPRGTRIGVHVFDAVTREITVMSSYVYHLLGF